MSGDMFRSLAHRHAQQTRAVIEERLKDLRQLKLRRATRLDDRLFFTRPDEIRAVFSQTKHGNDVFFWQADSVLRAPCQVPGPWTADGGHCALTA